jgi:hypothetical protein
MVMVTAATVVVAGLVTAGIAHARSSGDNEPVLTAPNAAAGTSLVLTVAPQSGAPRTVSLECDPTGGSHPHAADACAVLSAAGGQIDQVPPKQGEMCPHLVAPVHATATGTYRSTPVSYDHTFNNECEMSRATGAVFAF